MEEFNSTEAEVLETEVDSGEQTDVVDSSNVNHDFDLVDDEAKAENTGEESDGGDAEVVIQQSAEDNHAAKLARLKAERDAERKVAEAKKDIDRQIRESGAINPYTDRPFETMDEFLAYGKRVREADLKAKSEETGKSVEEIEEEEEVRKEIAQRKSKEETKTETKSDEDRARDDYIEILEKHPEVNVDVLIKNEKFRKFCGSRFGQEHLCSLYEDYAELVHEAERSAKADTRASRSTGSGSNGGERLTAEQRKSLDAWNDANPDMRMTPSEFLKR